MSRTACNTPITSIPPATGRYLLSLTLNVIPISRSHRSSQSGIQPFDQKFVNPCYLLGSLRIPRFEEAQSLTGSLLAREPGPESGETESEQVRERVFLL